MSQVMQMPQWRPVYVREQANKLYSPSAYFFAGWLVSTLNMMYYPLLVAGITFHYIGFLDNSFETFLRWFLGLFIQAFSGASFGFMFGAILDDEFVAMLYCQSAVIIFNFGNGVFANLGPQANWVVKFIGYVSPFRYLCEFLLRTLLRGTTYADALCDVFVYTFKEKCIPICIGFTCFFVLLSYSATVIKAKKM